VDRSFETAQAGAQIRTAFILGGSSSSSSSGSSSGSSSSRNNTACQPSRDDAMKGEQAGKWFDHHRHFQFRQFCASRPASSVNSAGAEKRIRTNERTRERNALGSEFFGFVRVSSSAHKSIRNKLLQVEAALRWGAKWAHQTYKYVNRRNQPAPLVGLSLYSAAVATAAARP
jgi:hypothetical protein